MKRTEMYTDDQYPANNPGWDESDAVSMLDDTGCTIIDWIYTKPVNDFAGAKGIKKLIRKQVRNLSFGVNKNLSADLWDGYSMMILDK